MSDNDLHCNNLKCRTLLGNEGKAVVTNCSHIFCVACANNLFTSAQICPACETSLTETCPDPTNQICSLNPTTEYKSSILSGLSPSVILEIASRSMSFWTYQTSQESAFQNMVLKNAQDRLLSMERQLGNINGELQSAHNKIANLENDLDMSSRRNQDLLDQQRDREREYTKLKANYDKLKRKHLLGPSINNENMLLQPQHTGTSIGNGRDMLGSGIQVPAPAMHRNRSSGDPFGLMHAHNQNIPSTPSGAAPQAFIPISNRNIHHPFQPPQINSTNKQRVINPGFGENYGSEGRTQRRVLENLGNGFGKEVGGTGGVWVWECTG